MFLSTAEESPEYNPPQKESEHYPSGDLQTITTAVIIIMMTNILNVVQLMYLITSVFLKSLPFQTRTVEYSRRSVSHK